MPVERNLNQAGGLVATGIILNKKFNIVIEPAASGIILEGLAKDIKAIYRKTLNYINGLKIPVVEI